MQRTLGKQEVLGISAVLLIHKLTGKEAPNSGQQCILGISK
jgi:hypothetical protein